MRIEKVSRTYRFVMFALSPLVRRWGRMSVSGLDALPLEGPILLAGNHDSYWDPVAIGMSAVSRRQICALAKASLWNIPVLSKILDGMGQIPITRGVGDRGALDAAVAKLESGGCIGIFPEGTTSRGRVLRARGGFGRLAAEVPSAHIVCVAVTGTVDLAHFPRRPRIAIEFFAPTGGPMQPGEEPAEFSQRLLDEIRVRAPRVATRRAKRRGVSDDD